jgi:hypothetical protein
MPIRFGAAHVVEKGRCLVEAVAGWTTEVSGVALEPIQDLASDLTRSQVEVLFEKSLNAQ